MSHFSAAISYSPAITITRFFCSLVLLGEPAVNKHKMAYCGVSIFRLQKLQSAAILWSSAHNRNITKKLRRSGFVFAVIFELKHCCTANQSFNVQSRLLYVLIRQGCKNTRRPNKIIGKKYANTDLYISLKQY